MNMLAYATGTEYAGDIVAQKILLVEQAAQAFAETATTIKDRITEGRGARIDVNIPESASPLEVVFTVIKHHWQNRHYASSEISWARRGTDKSNPLAPVFGYRRIPDAEDLALLAAIFSKIDNIACSSIIEKYGPKGLQAALGAIANTARAEDKPSDDIEPQLHSLTDRVFSISPGDIAPNTDDLQPALQNYISRILGGNTLADFMRARAILGGPTAPNQAADQNNTQRVITLLALAQQQQLFAFLTMPTGLDRTE